LKRHAIYVGLPTATLARKSPAGLDRQKRSIWPSSSPPKQLLSPHGYLQAPSSPTPCKKKKLDRQQDLRLNVLRASTRRTVCDQARQSPCAVCRLSLVRSTMTAVPPSRERRALRERLCRVRGPPQGVVFGDTRPIAEDVWARLVERTSTNQACFEDAFFNACAGRLSLNGGAVISQCKRIWNPRSNLRLRPPRPTASSAAPDVCVGFRPASSTALALQRLDRRVFAQPPVLGKAPGGTTLSPTTQNCFA